MAPAMTTMARALRGSPGILLLALSACGNTTPPSRDPLPADGSATASPSPPVSTGAAATLDAGAVVAAPADAGPPSAVVEDAGPPAEAPVVADNKVAPTEGAELQARAKGLFEAVVRDEPERAEAFWFPRSPSSRSRT